MSLAFDVDTYLNNKANELSWSGYDGKTDWTADEVSEAFADAGLTPEQHYTQWGMNEGVSLYADWDESAYLTNKITSLNDTGYETDTVSSGDWNIDSLMQSLADAELSPLEHYEKYGKYEGVSPVTNQLSAFGRDISKMETGSRSGLPEEYNDALLESVIPMLLESIENYRTDIDDSTKAAADLADQTGRTMIKTTAQDALNSLADRGVFGGSVADEAISNAISDVATNSSNQVFGSAMSGANMKAQEPSMLANIADLGKVSETFDDLSPFRFLVDAYSKFQ